MVIKVSYRVIYGDTDCGGVMYYGNYLRLFEIGRTEWIRQLGLPYRNIEKDYRIILPVVETKIRYKSPAYYDDLLTIETKLKEVKPFKLTFGYKIMKEETLLAEGYTIHVPVGVDLKIKRLPQDVLSLLGGKLTDK